MPKRKPGCAKPEEVLPRELAAIEQNDRVELAKCQGTYIRFNPDTAKKMADMLLLSNEIQPVLIAGVKKYGAKQLPVRWTSIARFMFDAFNLTSSTD